MATYDYDLGVIGAGSAGLTVTAGAAQLGVKTLLIEKEPELGGDCLHYGCVPSKTLIRTAEAYHTAKNLAAYGLPAAQVGPVDFSQVRARIRGVIEKILVHDSPERFCKLGAQVEFGEASFVDEHVVDLGGKRISAAKWVVSTGSTASAPPIEGLAETPYITNREIFYLDTLPESLIVLGGGPIAIEMAQAFARLGSKVQVVQRSAQILSKEDKDMADAVQGFLEAEGVTFHTGATTKRVRDAGGMREVVIEQNGAEKTLSAHTLLVALGRKSEVNTLGLDNAGVKLAKRGIEVDARMRTSQDHIYACGDCTGAYQFTHAAGYEGGIVVSNAVFRLPRKADYTWLPWCTYCQPELANIGMNEKRAEAAGLDYEVRVQEFSANDRALAEGEGRGKLKLILSKGAPVGVQILGPSAGELLAEWSALLNGKVKLSSLAGEVHAYPTLAEINKRVAGDIVGEKIFSDSVKKTLKFFFNYKGRACEMGLPEEE